MGLGANFFECAYSTAQTFFKVPDLTECLKIPPGSQSASLTILRSDLTRLCGRHITMSTVIQFTRYKECSWVGAPYLKRCDAYFNTIASTVAPTMMWAIQDSRFFKEEMGFGAGHGKEIT